VRIMWHSVAPMVSSGYGTQTRAVTRELVRQGHEVVISASYGVAGYVGRTEDGITVLPIGASPYNYGNDVIRLHVQRFNPDVVVSLLDVWVLKPEAWRGLPWCAWVPIDGEPLLPRNLPALRACRQPIAMARYGQRIMAEAGIESEFAPLGFAPEEYFPMPRDEARAVLGADRKTDIGDAFLVAVVSANVGQAGRKNFHEIFRAWASFHASHPGSLLYLHTDVSGILQGGDDLERMANLCGCAMDSIIIPDQYRYLFGGYDPAFLRAVYSASDLCLNPSRGEGFGLPIIEAQACGCPVAITDFAAGPELAGPGAWLMRGDLQWQIGGYRLAHVPASEIEAALHSASVGTSADAGRAERVKFASRWALPGVVRDELVPILERVVKANEQGKGKTDEDSSEPGAVAADASGGGA